MQSVGKHFIYPVKLQLRANSFIRNDIMCVKCEMCGCAHLRQRFKIKTEANTNESKP